MRYSEVIKKIFGYKSFQDKLIENGFEKSHEGIDEFLNLKTMKLTGKIDSDVFFKEKYLISSIKYYMNGETIFPRRDLVIFKNIPNKTPDWFVLSDGLSAKYRFSRNTDRVRSLNLIELKDKKPSVLASKTEDLPQWLGEFNYGYLSVEITNKGLCLSMPSYYDLEFAIEKIELMASRIFDGVVL